MPPAVVSSLAKGTLFTRFVIARALSNGWFEARDNAKRLFPQSPIVAEACEKAAVLAGDGSSWAAALIETGIGIDFLEAVRAAEVVSRLPRVRKVPANVPIPRNTSGFGAAWIQPGSSIPVTSSAWDTITLTATKVASLVVLTRELLRLLRPFSEAVVRQMLIDAVASATDESFLNPDLTEVVNGRPASITNGATEITSSGTTAAALADDLPRMVAAVPTRLAGAVWVMRPATWAHVLGKLGAMVNPPGVQLLNFPVLTTTSSPNSLGSPSSDTMIAFLDAAHVLLADAGAVAIDTSESAALELSDVPDANSVTGTPTEATSLFQTDSAAIRIIREVSWARATDCCAFMRVGY